MRVTALVARKHGCPITKTKTPRSRSTRRTAVSVAARSGMSISPSWHVATSNDASSSVARTWASSRTYRSVSGPPCRTAISNMAAESSTPSTSEAPTPASALDTRPCPQATSSTRRPRTSPSRPSVHSSAESVRPAPRLHQFVIPRGDVRPCRTVRLTHMPDSRTGDRSGSWSADAGQTKWISRSRAPRRAWHANSPASRIGRRRRPRWCLLGQR